MKKWLSKVWDNIKTIAIFIGFGLVALLVLGLIIIDVFNIRIVL